MYICSLYKSKCSIRFKGHREYIGCILAASTTGISLSLYVYMFVLYPIKKEGSQARPLRIKGEYLLSPSFPYMLCLFIGENTEEGLPRSLTPLLPHVVIYINVILFLYYPYTIYATILTPLRQPLVCIHCLRCQTKLT